MADKCRCCGVGALLWSLVMACESFMLEVLARERCKFESIANPILKQVLTRSLRAPTLVEGDEYADLSARSRGVEEAHARVDVTRNEGSLRWVRAAEADWRSPTVAAACGSNHLGDPA
jgi:hypothetical protein